MVRWLEKNNVPFHKRNVVLEPPTVQELLFMLRFTEKGLEDILSMSSKPIVALGRDLNKMSLMECLEYVSANPNALKRPILINTTQPRFIRGFEEEQLERILPRHIKIERRKKLYAELTV